MKKRLPRKEKKAMLTKQKLFDKSLGYKCRRKIMKKYMYMQYLMKIYKKGLTYNNINFASVRDTGESIQGTYQGIK